MLFAATPPPLEAFELLIAHTASHRDEGVHVILSDVKRVFPCSGAAGAPRRAAAGGRRLQGGIRRRVPTRFALQV